MLPACPSCRTLLSPARALQWRGEEIPMSPMTETTWTFYTASVSCPGCLAVSEVDDFGGGWTAKEVISSAGAARLRDRLVAARSDGLLEREVRSAFSNPTTALLLGTPELFELVTDALGREVSLRDDVTVWPGGASPGRGFPEAALQVRGALPGDARIGPAPLQHLRAGTRLTLTGVRERVLLARHESQGLLVPPDLVERA